MRVATLRPSAFPEEWEWLSGLLSPAIDLDPERDSSDVLRQLRAGELTAHLVQHPAGSGVIVTQVDEGDFWLIYAAGAGRGGHRARAAMYRDVAGFFEGLAREMGCSRFRIEGRNWSPVLKDYHSARLPGGRFSLWKGLR